MSISLEDAYVLARKALKHWPAVSGEPKLVMHRENTVFRVETSQGAAALRIHRAAYHSRPAILSELDWMAYLKQNGMQVPAPVETATGELFIELEDSAGDLRIVDLLTWLDGEPLGASYQPFIRPAAQTIEIFTNIGKALAELHNLSDRWVLPKGFQRHAWDREGLLGDQSFWGPFWTLSDISDEAHGILIQTRDQLRVDLDLLISAGLDYGLIHADLARENVLVAGSDVRMIDFDDAGYGFRIFDIATALIKNRYEPNYAEIEAALLQGYCSNRPLSSRDIAALPMFTLIRALTYLGWSEERKHEPGMAARREKFIDEALALAKNYLKN